MTHINVCMYTCSCATRHFGGQKYFAVLICNNTNIHHVVSSSYFKNSMS